MSSYWRKKIYSNEWDRGMGKKLSDGKYGGYVS